MEAFKMLTDEYGFPESKVRFFNGEGFTRIVDNTAPNSFVRHNIVLDDGTQTYPQKDIIMSECPLFLSSKRLLNIVFPRDKEGLRLVDLGCLEGGYTTEFARLGFETLGMMA